MAPRPPTFRVCWVVDMTAGSAPPNQGQDVCYEVDFDHNRRRRFYKIPPKFCDGFCSVPLMSLGCLLRFSGQGYTVS